MSLTGPEGSETFRLSSSDGKEIKFYSLPIFLDSIGTALNKPQERSWLVDTLFMLKLLRGICVYSSGITAEELSNMIPKTTYALERRVTQITYKEIQNECSRRVEDSVTVLSLWDLSELEKSDIPGTRCSTLLGINELICLYYVFSTETEGEHYLKRFFQGYAGRISNLVGKVTARLKAGM